MHCKCLRNVFEKFPSLSNDARPCEILTFMKLDGYPSEFEGNDYFLRVGGTHTKFLINAYFSRVGGTHPNFLTNAYICLFFGGGVTPGDQIRAYMILLRPLIH